MLELKILVWPKQEQPDRFFRPCILYYGIEYLWLHQAKASIDVCHLNVTSPVVIIVCTLTYRVCASTKVHDKNIRECAPFAKISKIIDREHFAKYDILSSRDFRLH